MYNILNIEILQLKKNSPADAKLRFSVLQNFTKTIEIIHAWILQI